MAGSMTNLGARQKQRGAISVFGVTIAVALTTGFLVQGLLTKIENTEQLITENVATTMFTIGETAQLYFEQEGEFPDAPNNCADALTVLEADGYLVGFQPLSGWGTPFEFDCAGGTRFDISAEAPEEQRAQTVASRLFTAEVVDETVTSSFPVPGAIPALNQVLYRVAVPGEPERNRMETDLDMDNNQILNARFGDIDMDGNDILDAGAVNGDEGNFITGNFQNANVDNALEAGQVIAGDVVVNDSLSVRGPIDGGGSPVAFDADIELNGTNDLRWGNSQLEASGTGPGGAADGIRLGAQAAGAAGGGGRAFIDFHFPGRASPNARIWNEDSGQLTVDAGRLEVTGGITTNAIAARDRISAEGFDSTVLDRRIESFVNDAGLFASGDTVPVPECGDLTPLIFTTPSSFASGLQAKPMAQVRTFADPPSGGVWRVRMEILTEDGFIEPDAAFGEIQVLTQCG